MHLRGRHLPALDGLRGLAAIWVFLYHLSDTGGPNRMLGQLGVDLFFVLSGFVLSYVYADRLNSASDYRRFLHARLARIYPLHLVTLLATAAVVLLWPGFAETYPRPELRFSADAFVAHLLLVQNWAVVLPSSWNTPAWSLSAEWAAYLAFPILLVATRHARWPLALALASMAALGLLLLAWGASAGAMGSPGMLRMACGALSGCLVHRAWRSGLRLSPLPTTLAAALLIAAAHLPGLDSLAPLAFPLLVLLCAQGEGLLARLCATRPVVWLGAISYSIYLWHWLAIQIGVRLPGIEPTGLVWNTAMIGIVLIISWASFHWIEQPARARLLRLSLGRRLPAGNG
jgi:peptidoglycan/LPS O-acetylase OafA/YrhL